MKKIIIYISIFSFFLPQMAFAGGGWPQKKGSGYFKLSQWWVIADQHFTDAGLIDPNVTNGLFNTAIYAEYGLTDRLTGIAYVPFFSRALFNNIVSETTGDILLQGEAINSFGDTDIGLKYGLTPNKRIAVSASLTLGLPLGNARGGSQGNLQTGDGEFNQLLQIDAGTSYRIGKINAYANAYVGFNNRTGGFSDEFRYGIETGATFFKDKLITLVRLYGIESFQNGSMREAITSTSVFANNSEHLTVSPEIAYQLTPKLGVSANLAKAITGKIIFANTAYSVGVYLKI